jgi:hypothetical protein
MGDKFCNAKSATSFIGVNTQYLHTYQFIFYCPFNSLQLWQAKMATEHKERKEYMAKELQHNFFSSIHTTPFPISFIQMTQF